MDEKTIQRLITEAEEAERAAREAHKALVAARAANWRERLTPAQRWLAERLPATTPHGDSPGALALDAAALGPGTDRVYCDPYFISVNGHSGAGLLRVLRALVELEEERERRRQAGEEVW